jgi:hypothetical protein
MGTINTKLNADMLGWFDVKAHTIFGRSVLSLPRWSFGW